MQQYNEAALKQDAAINFNKPYQQCTLSVMDTIADPDISFDEKGICNYYYEHVEKEKKFVFTGQQGKEKLDEIVAEIKQAGIGKKYDCITGASALAAGSMFVFQRPHRAVLISYPNHKELKKI